uniref:(northern house mosquito) hypothetical protein n=1 Tax=Culex pipiens TaxID=7175 RepID=A0A8D8JJA1_CULPI
MPDAESSSRCSSTLPTVLPKVHLLQPHRHRRYRKLFHHYHLHFYPRKATLHTLPTNNPRSGPIPRFPVLRSAPHTISWPTSRTSAPTSSTGACFDRSFTIQGALDP